MAQTMKIADVKNKLFSVVNEIYRKETRILVEKAGIPVATLDSVQDLKLFARLEEQRGDRSRVVVTMREPSRAVPPEVIVPRTTIPLAAKRCDHWS